MSLRRPVRYKADDIWNTPEDGNRYEVIDGVLYMATTPSSFHQWIIRQIARAPHPAEPAVAAHEHDIEHARREVPVDAAALRHVAHEPPLLGVGPAVHERSARRRLHEAEHSPDKGRLAGAVRPDDSHEDARRHREVDVPEDGLVGVRDGEIGDLDGVQLISLHPSRPATIVSMLCRTIPT